MVVDMLMKRYLQIVIFCCWMVSTAQHQDKVDFTHAEINIHPIASEKSIIGKVKYSFTALEQLDSVFLNAKNMQFSSVLLNGKKEKYINDGKTLTIRSKLKKGKIYSLVLEYTAVPKQTLYFIDSGKKSEHQIWTQGQGKYTSHWLPGFDDMQEKMEFDLTITANKQFKVIANGKLITTKNRTKETVDWVYDMKEPMSSYLLAFVIGDYEKEVLVSKNGITIENYYYPKDSLHVEPTYRYTQQIFGFLEQEIGVPYPWQNYKQIPVKDFLYAGMENTGTTIFSDGYVIDSTAFIDKNYVNVNAHELAHQWFGNLVTEKDSDHHWLHEGFATYYAYLAEKDIFGEDYYYWKLYRSLIELQSAVDRGDGQSLTDPKASSLTFYEKGAWALHILLEQIGEEAFKGGVKNYLKKYAFKNVTISNFLSEMELASGTDLSIYKKEWLVDTKIPFEAAKKYLRAKSTSLNVLFSMEEALGEKENNDFDFEDYWQQTSSVHLKQHIISKYQKKLSDPMINRAFVSDSIAIRQMLAIMIDSIPSNLKTQYESLLEDKSYVTIENALFKLWTTFPKEKAKYLETTKNIQGLPNKNVRLLWLTLAIVTNDYEGRKTNDHYTELSSYTAPKYGWETRMGAFQYLNEAIGINNKSLKDLVGASVHHSWQFKKFARNLLGELLKDSDYRTRLKSLVKELKGKELNYLNAKLKEQ
ncbi:Aminopeptidase [hydrothermal vent metagenome]|uniref:Aminopeptidase n=1 Tax=hydrothermal vent metagenome TaxID=652676 RepID=A0A3B0SWE7_9ZZZZ